MDMVAWTSGSTSEAQGEVTYDSKKFLEMSFTKTAYLEL